MYTYSPPYAQPAMMRLPGSQNLWQRATRSMSVAVRGVGTINTDIDSLRSLLAGEMETYGNALLDALSSGTLTGDKATALQASWSSLTDRNAALVSARASQDVLDQLNALQSDVAAWHTQFSAATRDVGLGKVFVFGSLAILAAGAVGWWVINQSLKRRRRHYRR